MFSVSPPDVSRSPGPASPCSSRGQSPGPAIPTLVEEKEESSTSV